jgi:hypothetical protein
MAGTSVRGFGSLALGDQRGHARPQSESWRDAVIQSYGLHWRLDRVDWGRPKVAGTLLGAASQARGRGQSISESREEYTPSMQSMI